MTKNEIRQQEKNQALNQIIKLYSKNGVDNLDMHHNETLAEIRDFEVRYVLDKLEVKLKEARDKEKFQPCEKCATSGHHLCTECLYRLVANS